MFELVIGRVPLDLTESEVSRYMNLYRVMAIRTQSGRMVRNSFAITAGVAVHRSASSPYTPLDSSSQELGTEVSRPASSRSHSLAHSLGRSADAWSPFVDG